MASIKWKGKLPSKLLHLRELQAASAADRLCTKVPESGIFLPLFDGQRADAPLRASEIEAADRMLKSKISWSLYAPDCAGL